MKARIKKSIQSSKVKNNRKIILIALLLILVIAIIIVFSNKKSITKTITLTPEILRSMSYEQVAEGDNNTNSDFVKFDAFFLRDLDDDGYAESIRGTCREIGGQDTLYMEIKVETEGYLKEGTITIDSKNFYFQTALPKDDQLQGNYIGTNIKEIKVANMLNGTQKLMQGIVKSGDYSYNSTIASAIGDNINNYSKENKILFEGTYVTSTGEEIAVNKEVKFNVDWHGTATADIYGTTRSADLKDTINEENQTIGLFFTIQTRELEGKLLLKENIIQAEIPKLNGYDPINVMCKDTKVQTSYDAETRIFTVRKSAEVNGNGKITSSLAREDNISVKIEYPLEAYKSLETNVVKIMVPVTTQYMGYNNSNEEFDNPYKSNIDKETILITYYDMKNKNNQTAFEVVVGKQVYDPEKRYVVSKGKPLKLYNGESEEEKNDEYTVGWIAYMGVDANLEGIIMKETKTNEPLVSDYFIKTNATQDSMDDLLSNKGIYFYNADYILGSEGWIKVYDDETGELLETFTSTNWNNYSFSNPYKYKFAIKHVRVETSPIIRKETKLYVYNIKEIDDDKLVNKYTREEFDNLQYINSTLQGYVGGEFKETVTGLANYEAPVSIAKISLSKDFISTQVTEKNEEIIIDTVVSKYENQVAWQNGVFLIKLPKEIIDIQINNVTINNNEINLESYAVIEENGETFIKLVTKNDIPTTYRIVIDADISPDPRISTKTGNIELYAVNKNGNDYLYKSNDIYDVDGDLSTDEMVNYTTTSINMVAPGTLLTNQIASDYDEKGSFVISPQIADIIPKFVVIDTEEAAKNVTIGVQVKNNYSSTISEVKVLGKIPFEGNTYALSGESLGSTYTTKMISPGIQVPDELKQYVKVYYSSKENPNRDLTDESNEWQASDQVENWDNIKSYIIDLGEYIMPVGKEIIFNYVVEVPKQVDFNEVSYAHHGVSFCLDTHEGKYRTQIEPNKLGLRIAFKYDLDLIKYQKDKDVLVPGATYEIKEILKDESENEVQGETKTGVTNNNGTISIVNLYAETLYQIKEINSPDNYELNSDVIRFIGHVDDTGNISIEKTEGNLKDNIIIDKNDRNKVIFKVEDKVKSKLLIIKTEEGTENRIAKVRYRIIGKGLPERGKVLLTNSSGEAEISGLLIGEEYLLEEVKADGYYLASPIKFKILDNSGEYSVEVLEGNIKSSSITEFDNLPKLTLEIENKKTPVYNLEITKIKRVTDIIESDTEQTLLPGAKFRLYKNDKMIGEYITDENGKFVIQGLSQGERDTFTLKEVLPPEGYSKVRDISFRVESIDGQLQFIEQLQSNEVAKDYTVEGNTIKLVIEDTSVFRLVKKDAETGLPIPNVKFAFYNSNTGEEPARNGNGEIVGNKEIINGKEYYVLKTDANGEISVNLPEGTYKAVEVEAPEQYDLENNEYYFGIGKNIQTFTKEELVIANTQSIGGTEDDYMTSTYATSDGGYLVGGHFKSDAIDLGNGQILNNKGTQGSSDGFIIKYNENNEIEWISQIGGASNEEINVVSETFDGGYIVGGSFKSSLIDLGNGQLLEKTGSSSYLDAMIIKYYSDGNVEWIKNIGTSKGDNIVYSITPTEDGGFVIGGACTGAYNFGNGISINTIGYQDGLVAKFDQSGEVQFARTIGGDNIDYIAKAIQTSDGGYLLSGRYYSNIINLENGIILDNSSSTKNYNGMVLKCDYDGSLQWAKKLEGAGNSDKDEITAILESSDGGYVTAGYYNYRNGSSSGDNRGSTAGIITKYTKQGIVEWEREVTGMDSEYIDDMIEVSDGYLITGSSNSSIIDFGTDASLLNKSSEKAFLTKYDFDGKVQWAELLGNIKINSLSKTTDEGIICAVKYNSDVSLKDEVTLNNNGGFDGAIVKMENIETPSLTVRDAKILKGDGDGYSYVTSTAPTSDGGYIAGGYYTSAKIALGAGKEIVNNTSGKKDGMLVKYSSSNKVEWGISIGSTGDDTIATVTETDDGGFLIGGEFTSASINFGNGVILSKTSSSSYSDGMIVKYDANGTAEWAKVIGGTYYHDGIYSVDKTADGGFIVGGYYWSELRLGNGITFTNNSNRSDAMVIKYNSAGSVEWAKSIGASGYNDSVTVVKGTSDGGCVAGVILPSKTVDFGNGFEFEKTGIDKNCAVVKYDKDGKTEWVNLDSETYHYFTSIESIIQTSTGEYVMVGTGRCNSSSSDSLLNNEVGIARKYDVNGNTLWEKYYGGKSNYDTLTSVIETQDGDYLFGGTFRSSKIEVGNEFICINSNSSTSTSDFALIKCDTNGNTKWARLMGSNGDDLIETLTETTSGAYIVGGEFNSDSINLENGIVLDNSNSSGSYSGMLIDLSTQGNILEIEELNVENIRKQFKITTEVKIVDGTKGGTISGEGLKEYEIVKYGDSNTQEIVMTPNENYKILSITVNGENHEFTPNEDNTYTMPVFNNITEDMHIVVKYTSVNNGNIIINKVDGITTERIEGTDFTLQQIDERTIPEDAIKDLTDNGPEYVTSINEEITGVKGNMNGYYIDYFAQNPDGTYEASNSQAYQIANGGTSGKASSVACSYMKIDLTDKEGKFAVVVNTSFKTVYSASYNRILARITESSTRIDSNNDTTTGVFLYAGGTVTNKDYVSKVLEGGKTYYLFLEYLKVANSTTDDDSVVINNISVHSVDTGKYVFNEVNGKYESNNSGVNSSVSNSYVPIDLRNCIGKYNLIVNAECSSEKNYDFGYATIRKDTVAPAHGDSVGQFIKLSGNEIAKDYSTVLDGGYLYYLHLGYYKDSSSSSGQDKFRVNSITLTLNEDGLCYREVTTNSNGQIMERIPYGKYILTETKATEGYILNNTPTILEFRRDGETEFTIENYKRPEIVVHHYIKDTTTKVADDEYVYGNVDEQYSTSPKVDLKDYELEKDIDGNYIIPTNATGQFEIINEDVIYYYVEKQKPLTVYHYIEGTTNKVPTLNNVNTEEKYFGREGDSYTTEFILSENLNGKYELSQIPVNATGVYDNDEVIVIYYYKLVERNINIQKYSEDGITPLADAIFTVTDEDGNVDEYTTDSEGKIALTLGAGNYQISEIQAPEGYKISADGIQQLQVTNQTEDGQTVTFINERKKGKVIVHHYIEGTTTKVPCRVEGEVADEIKEGVIGNNFATKPSVDVAPPYQCIGFEGNTSGSYTEDIQEVIYYYNIGTYQYKIEYYYDGVKDESKTEKLYANYEDVISNYQDKVEHGYRLLTTEEGITSGITGLIDGVVGLPLTISENIENNIIKVYYVRESSRVIVNYIDRNTGTILDTITEKGFVGEQYTAIARDFENYVLVKSPEEETVTFVETETVLNYYYVRVLTQMAEKHIDIKSKRVLYNELHEGNEGDSYTTNVKQFEGYDVVTNKQYYQEFTEVGLSEVLIKVAQEYIENGQVLTNEEIDAIKQNKLNQLLTKYGVTSKEELLENHKEGLVSDILTELVLNPEEAYIPSNADGTLTIEPIEVKYYYIRKTTVRVLYMDKITEEPILEEIEIDDNDDGVPDRTEERNSTEIILGHEGDSYETTPKSFDNYVLVQEEFPANATGIMEVTIDGEENINTETKVIYVYLPKTQVIENHIDIKNNKVLNTKSTDGYQTQLYEINSKEFDGYEIVTNKQFYTQKISEKIDILGEDRIEELIQQYNVNSKQELLEEYKEELVTEILTELGLNAGQNYIPSNYRGEMTKNSITVNYYYIRKAKVIVRYIDKITGETLKEVDEIGGAERDSTVIINGQEDDSYRAEEKEFQNYVIVEEMYPENTEGTMKVTTKEDGTVEDTITVTYYYVHSSGGVIEKHIDAITGEFLEESITHEGNEGDYYKIAPKEFELYELATDRLPSNAEGTMTIEPIEVIYYYSPIITAGLTFTKVAEEAPNEVLEGTEFAIYELIGESNDDERVNTIGEDLNWQLVSSYISSSEGVVEITNLPVNKEYRLVETKSAKGRLLPNGEWKIEFIAGEYDPNDTSIENVNGTLIRITAIGNPPAFVISQDGELKLPNKANYVFPISGGFGITEFYQTGIVIMALGMCIAIITKKRKKAIVKNRKKKSRIGMV